MYLMSAAAIGEEIDYRGGEIAVELDVTAKRSGDYLIVEADPEEYGDSDTETVDAAELWSSEDAPDVASDEDPCGDWVATMVVKARRSVMQRILRIMSASGLYCLTMTTQITSTTVSRLLIAEAQQGRLHQHLPPRD